MGFSDKPRAKPVLLCLLLVVVAYAPYVTRGGFANDDWSVASMAVHTHGIAQSYLYYLLSFSNRPMAPVYYALNAMFGDRFTGYIVVDILEWAAAVLIVASLIEKRFGMRMACLFMPFALLPTLASTVIFSPAMQSIGAASVLLWALSLLTLDKAIIRKSMPLAAASGFFLVLLLAMYEVALPLFVVSMAWPLLRAEKTGAAWKNKFFRLNVATTMGAVALMLIYQKLIAPHFFEDISRMRAVNGMQFVHLLITNSRAMWSIVFSAGPRFMLHAVPRLFALSSLPALSCWGTALVLFWLIAYRRPDDDAPPVPFFWFAAIVTSMFAVGVMHAGALMTPTIVGYTNRGLAAECILLPLAIATICSRVENARIGTAIAAVLFAGYAASFIVQSSDYIETAAVRERIYTQIAAAVEAGKYDNVIGEIPEFLPRNFNDEAIFANDLHDFGIFLQLKTQDRLSGEIITKMKICSRRTRVTIAGDTVVVDESQPLPLRNTLFYAYDPESGAPTLIPVHSGDQLRQILAQRDVCSAS